MHLAVMGCGWWRGRRLVAAGIDEWYRFCENYMGRLGDSSRFGSGERCSVWSLCALVRGVPMLVSCLCSVYLYRVLVLVTVSLNCCVTWYADADANAQTLGAVVCVAICCLDEFFLRLKTIPLIFIPAPGKLVR